MKALFKILVLLTSMMLVSCEDEAMFYVDNIPPSVPTNITTETGDNLVIIDWNPVYSDDLAGYAVYYSDSYDGEYHLLGTTSNSYFNDYGASNGITNYYAVASYDYDGNESELSYDVAYDTPRPEGFDQIIYDFRTYPNYSGYDFSNYRVESYNSDYTDFFFENYNGVLYLNVWVDSDIQDMGRTNSIYDISVAPVDGWVAAQPDENIKYVRAIRGNTYIIWTYDNHFAKIRISELYDDAVTFDWAYQTATGNIELKTNRGIGERTKKQEVIVNRTVN